MHSSPLVNAVTHSNGAAIGQLLHNDLEKVVLPAYPQVAQVRDTFAQTEVLGTMMSGSGPTIFALCESLEQAHQARDYVRKAIPDPNLEFWVTAVSSQGIQIGLSANS
jgi:4-diphosphocytidyl-2-C-methyl-D-erythritol kinase